MVKPVRWIAEKCMTAPDGTRVIARVGEPWQSSEGEWRAPLEVVVGQGTRRGEVCGIDGFQALYLALGLVGRYVAAVDSDVARQVRARVIFPRLLKAISESDADELDALIEQHYAERSARSQSRRRARDPE